MLKQLFLWLAICLAILLRVVSQPDGYTSPDSHAYLFKAENIHKHQSGVVAFGHPGTRQLKVASANWPIGYSALTYLVHKATFLPLLSASKVVNIAFLGLVFVVLYIWYRDSAWFVTSGFVSYCAFEIYSHTWSEGPFLFFVILLLHFIHLDLMRSFSKWRWLQISLCLIGLFLLRYAGFIYLGLAGLFAIYFIVDKQRIRAWQYILACTIAISFISAYLIYNNSVSGSFFGAHHVAMLDMGIYAFFKAYVNAISFARIYVKEPDLVYLVLIFFQLVILIWSGLAIKNNHSFQLSILNRVLLGVSIFYFLGITLLKVFITAIDFDYRIMSPFSLLLFTGLLGLISEVKNETWGIKWLKRSIVAFAAISYLVNLPNQFLLDLIL